MEFYTLDENYERDTIIDEFISAIWTERFIEPGDAQIVIPATHANAKLLAPGTLLTCKESREVVLLDTRTIQNGLITATGKTIEAFFEERLIEAFTVTNRPGVILGRIVERMQESPLGGLAITGLRTGILDTSGDMEKEAVVAGPVYTSLKTVAEKYNVGMSVFLTDNDAGNELVFSTRSGIDLTTDQTTNDVVRFSPNLDNLENVKELLSVAGSKNVVIVYPPDNLPIADDVSLIRVTNFPSLLDNPFEQRVMILECNDITKKMLGPSDSDTGDKLDRLHDLMVSRGKAALAANKRAKMIDGEITPDSQFGYRTHYHLGDTVEIAGYFSSPMKGTITEHIRSQDSSGQKTYPTVVVAAPPGTVSGGGGGENT